LPPVELRTAAPLAPLSTLGIGGAARWLMTVKSDADVVAAHEWGIQRDTTVFVLGGGSNLVIADEGIDALVLQIASRGVTFQPAGADTIVRAQAGESWDALVQQAVERGLSGVECLSGIPGSVGGTPIQNVGAYGQEVADVIDEVVAFDRRTATMVTMGKAECRFGYRMSRFKQEDAGRFVVCHVAFRLRPGVPTLTYPDLIRFMERESIAAPTVADVRRAVLAIRRAKGMVIDAADPDTRSVGSFFMNPVVPAAQHEALVAANPDASVPGFAQKDGQVKVPAAWLIEQAGFARGYEDGAVGLSSKHPLAIINRGGATAGDVLRLATRIKQKVTERFGILLRPEPVFVGFKDDPEVKYLQGN
jgi:UDP-N-acetylmuramate dehydrogenase